MSRLATRKTRCFTQAEAASAKAIQMKYITNQTMTETLRKQAKFINPYSLIGNKAENKSLNRYQRPHSIALISKTHQKMASEIKLSPYVELEEEHSQKYKLEKTIGKGLYSVVYRGYFAQTSKRVAIKKMAQDPRSKNQQIEILKQFNHCNILKIIDHYYTLQNGRRFLYIVTELHECDLFRHLREKRKKISEDALKSYAHQILKGLQELHKAGIVHRDLKSSNILINKQQNRAIIGDLGLARQLSFGEGVSGEACPHSYRAPELLFGANNYSFPADVWSFGCLLLEMASLTLPFKAHNSLEQLLQIIHLLGTPHIHEIYQSNPNYDIKQYQNLPKVKPRNIKDVYQINYPLTDLLKRILTYSPSKRITASEALRHEYFSGLTLDQTLDQQMLTDRSLIFTPPSFKKEHETLNTLTTFEDDSPLRIKTDLQFQSSQILLSRQGMNLPLKINRRLNF